MKYLLEWVLFLLGLYLWREAFILFLTTTTQYKAFLYDDLRLWFLFMLALYFLNERDKD